MIRKNLILRFYPQYYIPRYHAVCVGIKNIAKIDRNDKWLCKPCRDEEEYEVPSILEVTMKDEGAQFRNSFSRSFSVPPVTSTPVRSPKKSANSIDDISAIHGGSDVLIESDAETEEW